MEKVAYFDNAATTFPKPECVYTAMDEFARNCGVSLGRGQHRLSSKASKLCDDTRNLMLELLHCSNKKVVFTSTATEALNIILRSLYIPPNANVYVSPFEHNAVTRTLHYLKEKSNFNIIQLAADKNTLSLNLKDIERQFGLQKPFCVVSSYVSNVVGTIIPIEDLIISAKKHGAITVIDMCQSAGLIDIDISSDYYDYVVFAGHKTLYAPLGISGFVSSFPQQLEPLVIGGTGVESASQDMPTEIPIRFEAGSHNPALIAGLNASLKWIKQTTVEKIFRTEEEHQFKLNDILDRHRNITRIKPERSIGITSCLFDDYSSDEIGQILSENNIAFRTGLHCSPLAHKFIGTFPAGTVRFSVGFFNDDDDFLALDEVLTYIEVNS